MYSNLVDTIGFLKGEDPDVAEAMDKELARQKRNLELIASENIVSPAVMAAMGSVLTNKYAEGYPAKRYYGGCEAVDIVEIEHMAYGVARAHHAADDDEGRYDGRAARVDELLEAELEAEREK